MKGPSWLNALPSFDIIKGGRLIICTAYMLVVCQLLLRLWFTSKNHREPWYIGLCVKQVDERLCGFCPTDEIQRTPTPLNTQSSFGKLVLMVTYSCD